MSEAHLPYFPALEHFRDAVGRGWSVIPLQPRGKRSLIRWKPYQQRRADMGIVHSWLGQWPDANIGIVTGDVSGLVVLDVDGEQGDHSLRHMGVTPDTPVVRTARGAHLYFRHPGVQLGNFAGKLPGLDLRADGGYVVGAGSTHETGHAYEWVVTPEEAPLAEMPAWLIDLASEEEEAPAVGVDADGVVVPIKRRLTTSARVPESRERAFALAALAGEVRKVEAAPDGTKHDRLLDSAVALGGLTPHISEREIEDALFRAIAPRAADRHNALQTIRDGIAYGVRRPREIPDKHPSFVLDVGKSTELDAPPANVPIEVPVRDTVRLVRVWEEDEPEPRAFTVGALVPDKAVTLFYGDGGQGKSYIALYMGMVACLGRPFIGHLVQQSPVLFLDAELDDIEFRRRAYKMARGIDARRPPHGLHYLQLPGSLSDPSVQDIVRAAAAESAAGFVILDSLTIGSFAVDAADPSDMIKVVKFLESLGVAVLAIDHIAKPMPGTNLSQYRAYGSVFKGNVARSAIQIVRAEGGGLTLLHKKSNFSALSDPVHLALEFEDDYVRVVGLSPDDDRLVGAEENLPAVDQLYRELSQYRDGARPEFLSMEMGKSVKTIKNQLTALAKQNRAHAVGDGTWIADVPF